MGFTGESVSQSGDDGIKVLGHVPRDVSMIPVQGITCEMIPDVFGICPWISHIGLVNVRFVPFDERID